MSRWNKWKIITLCTVLNILFEYAVRGIANILNVYLLIGIIGTYFTYFTILEELIARYKLKDHQLMLWGFFLGIFVMAFTGGEMFNPRPGLEMFFIFGINYVDFFFVNVIWWSLFQTVITFYFANRIIKRDWDHSRLGKLGWALTLILFGVILFLFQLGRIRIYASYGFVLNFFRITQFIVFGTLPGYISMIVFVCIFGFLSFRELKKNEESESPIPEFESSTFLDVILILTIGISVICAFIISFNPSWSGASLVNRLGSAIIIIWSAILGIVTIIYRLISKQAISV